MSREQAARAYLDGLLGFRNDYGLFQQAADALTVSDRAKIEYAVSICFPPPRFRRGKG